MKRIFLFLATNLAVVVLLGLVANLLGVNRYLVGTSYTATQIDSALEKVLSHKSLLHLQEDDLLARINYLGESTSFPIISALNNQFSVVTNILSGSIEILQGTPIGSLVVAFSGTKDNIDQALKYLKENQVAVEIIDKARWERSKFKPEDTSVVPRED